MANLRLLQRPRLAPLEAPPRLADIRSDREFTALYERDFLPFCFAEHDKLRGKYSYICPSKWTDADLCESFQRPNDARTLMLLFEVIKDKCSLARASGQDLQITILELGAGASFASHPAHLGSPWLSRWLAKRFPELKVTVSDFRDDAILPLFIEVEKRFKIKGTLNIDYCDLTKQGHAPWDFIFGRHLNQDPSQEDIADIKHGIYKKISPGGKALLDFDQGPLIELSTENIARFNGGHYLALIDRASGERIIPIDSTELPRLTHASLPKYRRKH